MISPRSSVRRRLLASALLCFIALTACHAAAADDALEITRAEWKSEASELLVRGIHPEPGARVKLFDAETSENIADKRVNESGEWKKVIRGLDQAPCRVLATSNDMRAEHDVENAPDSCIEGGSYGGGYSGGHDTTAHSDLSYTGPGTCLGMGCHDIEANDVFHSTHYQWKGLALDMLNAPDQLQGKRAGAVNAYCGNILGNWNGCSACHIGLGVVPESAETAPFEQLANIDCLICHQEGYKRIKNEDGIFVPDWDNMTMDEFEVVRTVHKPTRATCLQCHAKAGGGDAVKRGDLALATANTTDRHYDVHMATTGANLVCQDCHTPEHHRFPGKGSDIRPTDLDVDLECASAGCHDARPHGGEEDGYLDGHTQRVACQTCHIPVYAKDAADTAASEATETHRSWQAGTHHDTQPYHPVTEKANNLTPVYRHWNRLSNNTLLFDQIFPNREGIYETSVPVGSVDDSESKLYPFKHKTSDYPLRTQGGNSQLIALDTSVFFTTKDEYVPDAAANAAAVSGLGNMKNLDPSFDPGDDYRWIITDTYQLLNHQVSDEDDALSCNQCHMSTARMDLQGDLGYRPTDRDQSSCASDCHSGEKASEWRFGDREEFEAGHKKHREKDVACSRCHNFER